MSEKRKRFSVCIPAYNRARYLRPLMDSILAQDYRDFEIVICEDGSPERPQIAHIVSEYRERVDVPIRYFENESNLGYDGNIRNLVDKARGEYCFFMGNDDILCEGALAEVASILGSHKNVGIIVKSYGWFDRVPEEVNQVVRYFTEITELGEGSDAIRFAFRRSGVISGYIVHRDAAHAVATSRFDGTLYYQMFLTANVLVNYSAVCTPKVLVLCRDSEPPDFGNSAREKGKYVPGRYTPQARLNMVGGAISIVRDLKESRNVDVVADIVHDYANYFYPYIKDQLELPVKDYFALYRSFSRMGFGRYPLFHVYFAAGYVLKEKRFDALTAYVRRRLGRSPRF